MTPAPPTGRRRRIPLAAPVLALCAAVLPGCVERYLLVKTDPEGAAVRVSGIPVGEGPVMHPFSFYGTVRVEASLPGWRTAEATVPLDMPWYQWFPLDFFADNLLPWTVVDEHTVSLQLEREPEWDDETRDRARLDVERVRARAERARAAAGSPDSDIEKETGPVPKPPEETRGERRP